MGIIKGQYKEYIAQQAFNRLDKAYITKDGESYEQDFYDSRIVDETKIEIFILLDHEDEGQFEKFEVLDTEGNTAMVKEDMFEKEPIIPQIIKFSFDVKEMEVE